MIFMDLSAYSSAVNCFSSSSSLTFLALWNFSSAFFGISLPSFFHFAIRALAYLALFFMILMYFSTPLLIGMVFLPLSASMVF